MRSASLRRLAYWLSPNCMTTDSRVPSRIYTSRDSAPPGRPAAGWPVSGDSDASGAEMLTLARHAGGDTQTDPGPAQGHLVQQGKALPPTKQSLSGARPRRYARGKLSSAIRSNNGHSPAADDKADHIEQDDWTSRDAYDYALKRAAGYVSDEERVAVAIFYSLFPDASSCYAAMDETGKERMRWCARAAIAALSEKRQPSR